MCSAENSARVGAKEPSPSPFRRYSIICKSHLWYKASRLWPFPRNLVRVISEFQRPRRRPGSTFWFFRHQPNHYMTSPCIPVADRLARHAQPPTTDLYSASRPQPHSTFEIVSRWPIPTPLLRLLWRLAHIQPWANRITYRPTSTQLSSTGFWLPESSIAGVTVKAPGSFTASAVRAQARYCLILLNHTSTFKSLRLPNTTAIRQPCQP